jgi:hypothetical protein
MEIIKHEHKIHDSDHKFTIMEICGKPEFFKTQNGKQQIQPKPVFNDYFLRNSHHR